MVFKKPPLQKCTLDNGKNPSRKNKSNENLSLFSAATLSQKGIPPINISQIATRQGQLLKLWLWKILLPPSLKVKITRLYVLLLRIGIVMDRKLLEKLEDIMALLMKLETIGTLSNMFVSTFGQWYLYPLVNILQLLYLFWFIICSSFVYFLLVAHPTSWWRDWKDNPNFRWY